MPKNRFPARPAAAAFALALAGSLPGTVLAQASVVPDGKVRATLGLGASRSSGNSNASNLSLNGDVVRATDRDKISLTGAAQYARTQGVTTGEKARAAGRYDRNLNARWFGFGGLSLEHDKFTNLKLRTLVEGGLGAHMVKTDTTTWDLFSGVGYSHDRYDTPMQVRGKLRRSDNYGTLLLAEESTHKLSDSTNFKQRLALTPALDGDGAFRATFDAGLAVAMTSTINLTVGFNASHNSDPGEGRKSTDTLLTTGVSMKFE